MSLKNSAVAAKKKSLLAIPDPEDRELPKKSSTPAAVVVSDQTTGPQGSHPQPQTTTSEESKRKVTLYLPTAVHKRLKHLAVDRDSQVSAIATDMLIQGLENINA